MTILSWLFITFPLIGSGTDQLLSKKFFDQMHSLDCDEMNKVEQSWTKLNKVEQSLRNCYRVISENLVKFDKQIAEKIGIC